MARRIVVVEVADSAATRAVAPRSPGNPEGDRWCVVPIAWGATVSLQVAETAAQAGMVLRERVGERVEHGLGAWFARLAVTLAGQDEPVPGLAVRQRAVEAVEAVMAPSGTGGGSAAVLGRSGGLVEVLETWPWVAGAGVGVVEDRPWSSGTDLGGCLPVRWRGMRPDGWGYATWPIGAVGEPDWVGTAAAGRMVAVAYGWGGIPLMVDWDEIAGWLPGAVSGRRTAAAWLVPCPDSSQRVTEWAFAWRLI